MFGVVLWSDEQEDKAVIWCEDHGDLAFYRKSDDEDKIALDAGDWVQFDMTMDRHLRFARNPRLVCDGVYPDIADALGVAVPQMPIKLQPGRGSADVIPFAMAKAKQTSLPREIKELHTA